MHTQFSIHRMHPANFEWYNYDASFELLRNNSHKGYLVVWQHGE